MPRYKTRMSLAIARPVRASGWVILCGVLLCCAACFGHSSAKTPAKGPLVAPAGTQVPGLGLAFDLSYDPATDNVVPGYRILTVGITNRSMKVVELKPLGDYWSVTDSHGHSHPAILNLRQKDGAVWSQLPPRLKTLIEYPLYVDLGETRAIDLIFPDSVKLAGFREVVFESVALEQAVRIYARETTN